jgi:hypothetical protein
MIAWPAAPTWPGRTRPAPRYDLAASDLAGDPLEWPALLDLEPEPLDAGVRTPH